MRLNFEKKLQRRQQCGNFRQLNLYPLLVDFSSNDYLGLARSSTLATTVIQEWKEHVSTASGLGSTGSRLLTGNCAYAQHLEEQIALFHGYEAGTLFNCGYMANVGLLSSVAGPEDCIFFDAEVHASTLDGIRLSRAQAFPFRHNDIAHLQHRLRSCSTSGDCFICTESIYSTDGSQAPLIEICQLANNHGAHLIVDEAHAVGVWGPNGRGLIAEHHLSSHLFAQVITFGKALGTQGAIVLGNHTLKQALINFATSFIYTTALPMQMLAAIKCSYDLFPKLDKERKHLHQLIHFFIQNYPSCSTTQIQSLPVKGNAEAKCVAQKLAAQGFDIRPLLSPTVRRGQEVLRICLHAFNTKTELERLINQIQSVMSTLSPASHGAPRDE